MSDGCATKGRSTTAFIQRSSTLRSGSGSSKGSPAKRSRGARASRTIIPFLWAKLYDDRGNRMGASHASKGGHSGATMCRVLPCRDVGKRPDRSSAFRLQSSRTGLPTQSGPISRCGPTRSTAVTSTAATDVATKRSMNQAHAKGPTERERRAKRDRLRHRQRHADRDCSKRVHRLRGAGSGLDAALDPSVLAPSP